MNFAPGFAMPRSKKNGKKGGRKKGKKGGKGDWGGGAQTGGRFEEEVNGPELGAKKCFKCQNPRAEDCCERSRSQGQDEETGQDQDQVGGGEHYDWRGDGHGRTSEWEADDEEDLCGWDGDQAFSYAWESREEDQKWNPEWRQAREEEQLRSLALWGVKGRDVFNIGPQYVVGKTTGLEALGTPVLKSLFTIPILEGRQQYIRNVLYDLLNGDPPPPLKLLIICTTILGGCTEDIIHYFTFLSS